MSFPGLRNMVNERKLMLQNPEIINVTYSLEVNTETVKKLLKP